MIDSEGAVWPVVFASKRYEHTLWAEVQRGALTLVLAREPGKLCSKGLPLPKSTTEYWLRSGT
jgi:hypothetical protein